MSTITGDAKLDSELIRTFTRTEHEFFNINKNLYIKPNFLPLSATVTCACYGGELVSYCCRYRWPQM